MGSGRREVLILAKREEPGKRCDLYFLVSLQLTDERTQRKTDKRTFLYVLGGKVHKAS
jgi:hypothetical protein